MLDQKFTQLPPPRDSGGGGCGPEREVLTVLEHDREPPGWRDSDFDSMSTDKMIRVENGARPIIENLRWKIAEGQARYNRDVKDVKDQETIYQDSKKRHIFYNENMLTAARESRDRSLADLQRVKFDLKQVEANRDQKIIEILDLRNRAKDGDYRSFRGLTYYDTKFYPDKKY